jgi:hypothetical protein
MQPYLVFDLRNHRFAAGVVDNVDGILRWKTEMVSIWQREGIYDSVEVADLCFFRPPREKGWRPISSTALSQLPDDYEKVANLFEEPDDRLRVIIKPALRPLLSPLMKLYEKLDILFLTDTVKANDHLAEITSIINRPYRIIVTPEDNNKHAGFALLDMEKGELPRSKKTFICTIEENLFSYHWNDGYFEPVASAGLHSKSESEWARFSDMERVGLIAFELIWSEKLLPKLKKDLEKIIGENDLLSKLLARMNQINLELQGFLGSKLTEQD